MKTKHVFQIAMSFALVALISSCSGKKTESTEQDEHQHMAATEMSDASTSEIKVFENIDGSVKTQISGLLTNYLALNKALTVDNNEVAKTEVKTFADNLAKFDMTKLVGEQMDFYHIQLAKISSSLKSINESANIEESRTQLSDVSEGMYALVKAYHSNESELYYQFCPMANNHAGAFWLSETKEIVNPYMGQKMLTCGMTKEKL